MCRLKLKIRVIGKKNQEFVRCILVPKDIRQKGKYLMTLGYWDTRQNKNIRPITFNIYNVMYYYFLGATWSTKILHYLYYFFVDIHNLRKFVYFEPSQIKLFLENEIKNKYK